MAPDIALSKIGELSKPGALVLDPMCGSGTVLRAAVDSGCSAIGCDLDPLAVLMSRVSCDASMSADLEARAEEAVANAKQASPELPDWIKADTDSTNFCNYWFGESQRQALSQLARHFATCDTAEDGLRLALSRTIVTKDGGASLARDTSHSRPHRVTLENDYDVFGGFVAAARRLERGAAAISPDWKGSVSIALDDARSLYTVDSGSIDLIVTSPPYLNAIDYLRGHRMSLVWLGHTISSLRVVRSTSIGAERAPDAVDVGAEKIASSALTNGKGLSERELRMVDRFAADMLRLSRAMWRVLKPGASLVLVVADSNRRGAKISNSVIARASAESVGFTLLRSTTREIPSGSRYLPPPTGTSGSMAKRMRHEHILELAKS